MDPFTITVMHDRQQLIYLPGNGTAITLDDRAGTSMSSLSPIERAVLATRLRAWAELVEEQP